MSKTLGKVVLWQIQDGKPGHLNQLRGLTEALSELLPLDVHELPSPPLRNSLAAFFAKQFLLCEDLPSPDLILGAGHSTHLAVLAAKRCYGGKAIVLMKPSLPTALFDLCLIPEHDQVAQATKVVTTHGALNLVKPSDQHDPNAGLFLVGGPSANFSWSDEKMINQVATIAASNPQVLWQLTTSRRTPASFLRGQADYNLPNLKIVPHQETTFGWVPEQLAQASQVWVTEDSVSMVYEALTSGAAVGLLEVPGKRRGRVARGIDSLAHDGWVTRFSAHSANSRLAFPPEQLDEARRCAEIISERFFAKAAA